MYFPERGSFDVENNFVVVDWLADSTEQRQTVVTDLSVCTRISFECVSFWYPQAGFCFQIPAKDIVAYK